MRNKNLPYLVLLVWTFAAGFIDRAGLLPGTAASIFDIAHFGVFVILTWLWCNADAEAEGYPRVGGLTALAMVLVAPVGLGIHLFRSRMPGRATVLLMGYVAGFAAAYLAGWYAAALTYVPAPLPAA